MLQSIRDHTHGWIAGVIISLLILSFALWGIHSYLEAGCNNNVIAKVNGVEITRNQLAVAYERLHRQLQIQFGAKYVLPLQAEADLKQRALQTLIDIQVLQQASFKQDYRISSRQVDGFLQSIPEFQVNGEFSIARFQQALTVTMFSANDFLNMIQTSLLIDQPRLGILLTSFALPSEVENIISLVGQERNIQYVVIPQERFTKQPMNITDAAVKAYYAEHQNEFKTPEQVSINYIVLSLKDLSSTIHPTDDALKSFYNDYSNSFASPPEWQLDELVIPLGAKATDQEIADAKNKVDAIVKAADAGTSFAELAEKYSVTRIDKTKSWVPLNQLPVELQKNISSLTKPNQISAPVRIANNGIVIAKVVNYKEPAALPFEKVKDKVKEAYARQQAEERFGDLREKLANATYEHPDSLAEAAKELGLVVKTSALFTREKGDNDITAHVKIREAAFSNDVLNSQNNSDVIQIDPDQVTVIRVKSHVPAALLSQEAVRQKIIDKLSAAVSEEKAQNFAQELQKKLQSGELSSAQVGSQYQLTWVTPGFISRHTAKIDQAVLDTTFEMPKPKNNKPVYAVTKVANGYAIVGLNDIKDGNANSSKEQYQIYAEQVQNSQGLLEYELYKDDLMRRAKIVKEN